MVPEEQQERLTSLPSTFVCTCTHTWDGFTHLLKRNSRRLQCVLTENLGREVGDREERLWRKECSGSDCSGLCTQCHLQGIRRLYKGRRAVALWSSCGEPTLQGLGVLSRVPAPLLESGSLKVCPFIGYTLLVCRSDHRPSPPPFKKKPQGPGV